jgi:CheY-specific phosphatase CheX
MTAFPLAPYRAGIALVVASVYENMLGLPVRQIPPWQEPLPSPLTGAVYYAGTWQGALFLECALEQARDWAARLMALDPPVDPEDVRDGLGELANVVAGNLKPLLPPGVGLSLPAVVQGSDFSLRTCGGNPAETLYLADPLGPFRITLVELVG